MKKPPICATPQCSNEVKKDGSYCVNCKSSLYYWRKKRPAQILKRRGQLALYSERLNEFFGGK